MLYAAGMERCTHAETSDGAIRAPGWKDRAQYFRQSVVHKGFPVSKLTGQAVWLRAGVDSGSPVTVDCTAAGEIAGKKKAES